MFCLLLFASSNRAARDGGGVRAVLGSLSTKLSAVFTGNTAGGDGGAIFTENSPMTVQDTSFSLNEATAGGAVRFSSGTSFVVQGSTFTSNRATQGGALSAELSTSVSVSGSLVCLLSLQCSRMMELRLVIVGAWCAWEAPVSVLFCVELM